MNEIHSMHRKAGFSSHVPPEYLPSLTFSIKSDTNMGTEGNFFDSIPSPLVSSQLDHIVGAGSPPSLQNLPQLNLQNYRFCKLLTQSKLQTKLQLSVCTWGFCC
jgi:hypothetical protein